MRDMDKEKTARDKVAAMNDAPDRASSIMGTHTTELLLHSSLTSKRLRLLARVFVTPEPGETRPDPRTLGDPFEYDGLGSFVRLLQLGAEPGEVLRLMPSEIHQVVAAADPSRPAPPPLKLLTADDILKFRTETSP